MYRFLADNAMDLITRHSADGRIRFASPAAQGLLGVAPDELIGLAPAALVHPDDLNAIQAALHGGELFRPRRHRRRSGSSAPMAPMSGRRSVAAPQRPPRARPPTSSPSRATSPSARTTSSALIEARDLAEQANRAKSQLPRQYEPRAAHAAERDHRLLRGDDARDVRARGQPALSGIFAADPRERRASARAHQRHSRHVEDRGRQVRTVARRSSIWRKPRPPACASCASRRSAQASRSGPPSHRARGTIFADKRAIKQMLVNLLSNGVKFTPRGGEVRIAASARQRAASRSRCPIPASAFRRAIWSVSASPSSRSRASMCARRKARASVSRW